jgi:hypothetical protein
LGHGASLSAVSVSAMKLGRQADHPRSPLRPDQRCPT